MPRKKKPPPFTNKRSRILRRKLYSAERFGVYLGLNITPEMHAELVEAAEKALMRQSDFARLMLKEGLRVWRTTKGREFRDVPIEGEN